MGITKYEKHKIQLLMLWSITNYVQFIFEKYEKL